MPAGLIVAVAGLSAQMPAPALVTSTAEAATAVFGGVIALSGTAATLFFNTAEASARLLAPRAVWPGPDLMWPAGYRTGPPLALA
jgi:hypothetical protein